MARLSQKSVSHWQIETLKVKFLTCMHAYRAYRENGWIVRILDKRETVYGSSWYLLHHSTLRLGIKRFHAITWFGRCAYNNFKTKGLLDECKAEIKCFVCGGEMEKCFYVGNLSFAKNIGDVDYEPFFAVPASESDNFVKIVGRHAHG